MSTPDVESLLREHGLNLSDDAGRWMCRCGWTTQTVPVATDHRAHQAAIITAAYAETLAEAWDEGWEYSGKVGASPKSANPYRRRIEGA